jgi:hypothetical protein
MSKKEFCWGLRRSLYALVQWLSKLFEACKERKPGAGN